MDGGILLLLGIHKECTQGLGSMVKAIHHDDLTFLQLTNLVVGKEHRGKGKSWRQLLSEKHGHGFAQRHGGHSVNTGGALACWKIHHTEPCLSPKTVLCICNQCLVQLLLLLALFRTFLNKKPVSCCHVARLRTIVPQTSPFGRIFAGELIWSTIRWPKVRSKGNFEIFVAF